MTRTCKSTRRQTLEIASNLALLREAHYHLMDPDIDWRLLDLIRTWLSRRCKQDNGQPIFNLIHRSRHVDQDICLVFNTSTITFYSTAFIGHVRFTTWKYADGKATDDSCIMFRSAQTRMFGRISRTFTIDEQTEPVFKIQVLTNTKPLENYIGDDTIGEFTRKQNGSLDDPNYSFVRAHDILEKRVSFQCEPMNTFTLIRFPNLDESS
jgi:hypothetical protein